MVIYDIYIKMIYARPASVLRPSCVVSRASRARPSCVSRPSRTYNTPVPHLQHACHLPVPCPSSVFPAAVQRPFSASPTAMVSLLKDVFVLL